MPGKAGLPTNDRFYQRNPIVSILLALMRSVTFMAERYETEWKTYNITEDFLHIYELALIVGVYFFENRFNVAQSPVLQKFMHATQELSPFMHFKHLSGLTMSPDICVSMSAIYCCWCVRQQLGDQSPDYKFIEQKLQSVLRFVPSAFQDYDKNALKNFFMYTSLQLNTQDVEKQECRCAGDILEGFTFMPAPPRLPLDPPMLCCWDTSEEREAAEVLRNFSWMSGV